MTNVLRHQKLKISVPQKSERFLRKPTRSISGIVPVAVVLPEKKCEHGTCRYCPTWQKIPQSYTPKSPAILRGRKLKFDAYEQVLHRLKSLKAMGHSIDKIELIIIGGTFMQFDKKFRDNFVLGCFNALNGKKSKSLKQAQKINETAECRCVGFCIETRPDNCSIDKIEEMRKYGVTRVELGVQNPDDKIYKLINRGHTVKDVVLATERLRNAGFKIGYHIMPGLPGSDLKKDILMFKKLFSSQNFKPDQLKIYPCQVIRGSRLEKDYYSGKYVPYDEEQTEKLLREIMLLIPRYCRIMRVMREIPIDYLIAGAARIDLRKIVEEGLRKNKDKIKEIRFREIGFNQTANKKIKLKITEYKASNGKEFFLEFINSEEILFGLLRLRLGKNWDLKELKDCALIRELHIYGKSIELGEKGENQHTGLGKKLINEAEKIALHNGYKKVAVISGVGVREYYKKLGYKLQENYMIKRLD